MRRLVILMVLCGTIFCACTTDKNRDGNNLPTGSSIENNTTGSVAAASGATASVTEAAVKTDASKKIRTDDISTLRYANDKNIYLGFDQGIYQYDLCGRRQKFYDMCKELGKNYYWTEVLWVDNDDVFFSCHPNSYYCEIWRVPLTKKKNGLKVKEKEKIAAKMEELDCLVTKTNEEIIYCADGELNKVSLKTKQKQVLKTSTDYHIPVSVIMKDRNGIPFIQDNKIYYEGERDRIYQMDLDDWKPVYIGEKGGLIEYIETEGINLYFETQDENPNRFKLFNIKVKKWFAKYNLQSGKKAKLFSREKLMEEVEKLGKTWESFTNKLDWEEWAYPDIEAVYYYENRLYIAVRVMTGEYDEWEAWLMFSCQASDGSDFRFEKEVTEYLWKNSIPFKIEFEDEHSMDLEQVTGEFSYFLDGCIVMYFYDQEAKGDEDAHHRFAVYDISTGTFRRVKRYSKEYGYFKALGFMGY